MLPTVSLLKARYISFSSLKVAFSVEEWLWYFETHTNTVKTLQDILQYMPQSAVYIYNNNNNSIFFCSRNRFQKLGTKIYIPTQVG
jgi:hypothetical protein